MLYEPFPLCGSRSICSIRRQIYWPIHVFLRLDLIYFRKTLIFFFLSLIAEYCGKTLNANFKTTTSASHRYMIYVYGMHSYRTHFNNNKLRDNYLLNCKSTPIRKSEGLTDFFYSTDWIFFYVPRAEIVLKI